MSEERLQKILSQAGVASRRKAEELIRQGLVTVNGALAELGQKADPRVDKIKVAGKAVRPPSRSHRYLLLNKPTGCVSTVSDPEGRTTVLDLVPQRLRRGLAPVGRLDFHSEGLLLLTDDGGWAHRVAHPRFGCQKVYLAKVRGVPAAEAIDRLRAGIVLEGKRTAPCEIVPHRPDKGARQARKNSWWEVRLSEGRNRQIREMFQRIGHPLQRLKRVAIGPIVDGGLPSGSWRELTEQEVEGLAAGEKPPAQLQKPPRPRRTPRTAEAAGRPRAAGPKRPTRGRAKGSESERGRGERPPKGKGRGERPATGPGRGKRRSQGPGRGKGSPTGGGRRER